MYNFFDSKIACQTFYTTFKIILVDEMTCLECVLSCPMFCIWKLSVFDVWEGSWETLLLILGPPGKFLVALWIGWLIFWETELHFLSESEDVLMHPDVWNCEDLRKIHCRNLKCGQTVKREYHLISDPRFRMGLRAMSDLHFCIYMLYYYRHILKVVFPRTWLCGKCSGWF